MNTTTNRRLADWLKRIWDRTGTVPVMEIPKSSVLLDWFRRHVAPLPPRGMVQTIGDRLRAALGGGASQAVVLVPVAIEARHASGVDFQASPSYATGLLDIARAREIAERLKEQGAIVVPYFADGTQRLLDGHLARRRRHDGNPAPEVLSLTEDLGQRMRNMGMVPTTMTLEQAQGIEPLPGQARVPRPRPAYAPRQAPALEPGPVPRPSFAV